jgi:hypothetical protein
MDVFFIHAQSTIRADGFLSAQHPNSAATARDDLDRHV